MDYTSIKKLASAKGMTLKTLAESIGITAQGFHGYVKKNTMPIDKLEAIADLLNVHLLELFGSDEPETSKEVVELLRENRELRKRLDEFESQSKSKIEFHDKPLSKS